MSLFNECFYTDDFDQEMIDYVDTLGNFTNRGYIGRYSGQFYLKYAIGNNYFWASNLRCPKEYKHLTKQQFKEKIGMTQKQFTKADLKTGMIIEFINGELGQVLLGTLNGDIVTGETWFPLATRNNTELFELKDPESVKTVYSPKNNKFLCLKQAKINNLSHYEYTVVWKREEKSAEQIEIEKIQAEMEQLNKRLGELKAKV